MPHKIVFCLVHDKIINKVIWFLILKFYLNQTKQISLVIFIIYSLVMLHPIIIIWEFDRNKIRKDNSENLR